ncbi:MAG: peptidoglycan DD-metalloendopeptidase family protein [Rhodothermaceae bacterium]|nr:peptidoglycan DD-metalloendopeptidase family protein [Rhodothermaceae bacterium]
MRPFITCMCSYTQRARILQSAILLLLPVVIIGCSTLSTNSDLSDSFLAQKGHLDWPTEGVIAKSFGTDVNPVYSTKTINPGIWISTAPQAEVNAVFDGEVTAVYTMPEFGRVITINHGDYTSLYGNLSSLQVAEGMPVEAGQLIGVSGTENEPRGESVFFAVFKDGAEENPEDWLASN